jgi:hypothetical protein
MIQDQADSVWFLKAACLQVSQNVSRKSDLRKRYYHIKKVRRIQNKDINVHGMYDLSPILQYFSPYIVTNALRAVYAYIDPLILEI